MNLTHISTGNILRGAVEKGTAAGKLAEPFMKAGKLVPDDVVNQLVADRFSGPDKPERYVFDGYPRTLPQAVALDVVLSKEKLEANAVVVLELEDEEVVRRITGRRVCPKDQTPYHIHSKPPKTPGKCDICGTELIQRSDDTEATARERVRVYREQTAELIPFYRAKGLLREIPGQGDIEAIYAAMVKAIS